MVYRPTRLTVKRNLTNYRFTMTDESFPYSDRDAVEILKFAGYRKKHALSEAQNHRCAYCQKILDPSISDHRHPMIVTIDHVHPLGLGGKRRWDNEVAACRECNNLRGIMDAYEFHEKRVWLIEQRANRMRGIVAKNTWKGRKTKSAAYRQARHEWEQRLAQEPKELRRRIVNVAEWAERMGLVPTVLLQDVAVDKGATMAHSGGQGGDKDV